VHLYSTHTPYDPPAEFKALYEDPGYGGPIRAFWADHRIAIEQGKYVPTSADVDEIRNLYYAGVSQADRMIGDLVDELERGGLREDTLVIVTSDHGESLGEQGLWEHVHMAQTNLRVPLVMSWARGLPRGKRVGAMTDEIDVLPTVCDLLGLELPHDEGERGKIDGTSLLPLVRGEADAVREFSFAENGTHLSIQDARLKLIVPRAMLDEEGWAAGLAGRGDKPRLYDLVLDPAEEHDVAAGRPGDADRLAKALRAWSASLPIPLHDTLPSDRNRENQKLLFRRLGYTDGGVGEGEKE
jgi:choline-sulfatase